jgi:transposase
MAATAATVALAFPLLQGGGRPQEYATAVGERRDGRLADGSLLHLNTGTRVLVQMRDDARLIRLDAGEASFDVAHQPRQWPPRIARRRDPAAPPRGLKTLVTVQPDLKAKYQQLVAAGKPAKIAITAVMRKLVVTANALLKADRCWQQSLA